MAAASADTYHRMRIGSAWSARPCATCLRGLQAATRWPAASGLPGARCVDRAPEPGRTDLVRADAGLLDGDRPPAQRAGVYGRLLPRRQHGAQRQVRPGSPERHPRAVANAGGLRAAGRRSAPGGAPPRRLRRPEPFAPLAAQTGRRSEPGLRWHPQRSPKLATTAGGLRGRPPPCWRAWRACTF